MYKLLAAAAFASLLSLAACGGGDCKAACEASANCIEDEALRQSAIESCVVYDVPGSCTYSDDTVSCIADAGDDCEAIAACE